MDKLANLTQTDINNGVLMRMLADAGIPDVQGYVKHFHQETEELIIEEFEHPDPNKVDNDEQIVPPADIQKWITGLRPRFDDPIQPPLAEVQQKQQEQQPLPQNVSSWITGLRPRFDDPTQPPLSEQQPKQQQQKQPPTDLKSWMQRMAPDDTHPSTDTTTTIASSDNPAITGNLSTWLNNWSKNLTEQPPPASLDKWLQSLIPRDMHEPINKANSSKVRLNSYLNAAQEVLSQHGYNVSNEVAPPTNVQVKTGMFGNVKQMYFLWKVLDKNHDRKITVEDVQIMLQEMGLGFLSKSLAQSLFEMVDSNHDGELQFRDCVALMGIIKQLIGAVGSAKTKT